MQSTKTQKPKSKNTKSKIPKLKSFVKKMGKLAHYFDKFLDVGRLGMTREISEKKTPDGVLVTNTVKISDAVRGVLRNMDLQNGGKPVRAMVSSSTAVTTNSSGVGTTTAFSLDPTGAANWTEYAAIFDQFRVVGGYVTFSTTSILATGVQASGSIYIAFDNNNTVTGAAQTCVAYPNYKFGCVAPHFSYSWRRPDLSVLPYVTTADGTLSLGSVPFYIVGGPATVTNCYHVALTLEVEFLGIR